MGSQTGPEALAQPLKVGTMLGRYQLLETLGSGGMATVYLAELRAEQGFSRRVALKVVHAHLALQPDFSQWFISEARLGGVLHHPNLVATLDFGQLDGHWFMAMEHVDGWTLSELARLLLPAYPTLPITISCQVMIQICRGLQHAHQARDAAGHPLHIVHRDIKPSNILIDRHGTAKLADFGVARAESNVSKTVASGVVKGSFRHMPPEQALASRDLDARADLFAMGTVFYQLLTGRAVYQADNQMQALRMAMDGEVGPALAALPTLPAQGRILHILHHTLAKDRQARFSSAAELEDALTELLHAVGSLPTLNTRWLEEAQRAATQQAEAIQRGRQEWLTPSPLPEEAPTTPSHPNQRVGQVAHPVASAAAPTPSHFAPTEQGLVKPVAPVSSPAQATHTTPRAAAAATAPREGGSPPSVQVARGGARWGLVGMGVVLLMGLLLMGLWWSSTLQRSAPSTSEQVSHATIQGTNDAAEAPARASTSEPVSPPAEEGVNVASAQTGATLREGSGSASAGGGNVAEAEVLRNSEGAPAPATSASNKLGSGKKAATRGYARLYVNARPCVELEINGRRFPCPVEGLNVASGTQRLTAFFEEQAPQTLTVTLQGGELGRCLFSSTMPEGRCRVEPASPEGASTHAE